jgi:hypothetical protein
MILAEISRDSSNYYWKIFPCNEEQFLKLSEARKITVSQYLSFAEEDAIEGLLNHFNVSPNH